MAIKNLQLQCHNALKSRLIRKIFVISSKLIFMLVYRSFIVDFELTRRAFFLNHGLILKNRSKLNIISLSVFFY